MNWVALARELQAMSRTGLEFAQDPYDRERYDRLGQLAAQVLAAHSNLPVDTFIAWNKAEFGYPTPKVDVRGVIMAQGRILLVSETADQGRWTLPGGWADVNESPSESVLREVREETGYACRVVSLLGVLDREKQGHLPPVPYHVYKLFFHCQIVGGTPTRTPEAAGSAFFELGHLPELSVSRVRAEQIRRFADKIQRDDKGTDFD